MNNFKTLAAGLVLCAGFSWPMTAEARTFVVQFLGPSEITHEFDEALKRMDLDPAEFTCFKMPLVDPESKLTLGKGTDCLKFDQITPKPALAVDAVSFFIFPQGKIVAKGRTSLQPFVPGFGNGGTPPRTHITGSIPSEPNLRGTRAFRRIKGTARVSGAVALEGTENGNPFFDCLWVLDFRIRHPHDRLSDATGDVMP